MIRVAITFALCAVLAGCGSKGPSTNLSGVIPSVPNNSTTTTPQQVFGLNRVPANTPAVVDQGFYARVHPAKLSIASDGTLNALHWSGWGQPSAEAKGTLAAWICQNTCAGGHSQHYPATVTLSDLVTCSGRRYYNTARVMIATARGSRRWGSFVHAPCKPQPIGGGN